MPARRNFLQKKIFVSRNCGIFIILGVSAKKNFGFLAEKFGSVVNLEIYVPGWTFWTKKLIGVKGIFYRFRNSSTRSSDFHWDTSGGIVKGSTYLSRGTFWGGVKVLSKSQFIFFGLPAKSIRPTGDVFSVGLWKVKSQSPEEYFEGKSFFWESFLISFAPFVNETLQDFQHSFLCVQRKFSSEISVKFKIFHPFITLSREKSTLIWFFLARSPKRQSTCKKEKFEEKSVLFAATRIFVSLSDFQQKSLEVWQKKIATVVKTAFYVSRGNIEWIWCENFVFSSFHHLERKKSTFDWNFLARLPKRHSTCPRKSFEERSDFSGETVTFLLLISRKVFFSSFSIFRQKNGLLVSFSEGLTKYQSTCPDECFSEM